jgi:hypothetical protein
MMWSISTNKTSMRPWYVASLAAHNPHRTIESTKMIAKGKGPAIAEHPRPAGLVLVRRHPESGSNT